LRFASTSKKPPQFRDAGFQIVMLVAQLLRGIGIEHCWDSFKSGSR
jgi:hypothetical protein